jgi:hypothetical protein
MLLIAITCIIIVLYEHNGPPFLIYYHLWTVEIGPVSAANSILTYALQSAPM